MTGTSVGVVGLGNMGSRIARRLLDTGHNVAVYDQSVQAVERLSQAGATPTSSPAQLAAVADIVLTVLPNGGIVRQVVFGSEGLAQAMDERSVLIDITSANPTETRETGRLLAERRIAMLDAPVSGGVEKAESGTLTVIVGGDVSLYEHYLPLLRQIGSRVFHAGELGAGHAAKMLNNLLCAATLAVTSEAMALGVKLGLDPERLLEIINASSGRSLSSEIKFPQQVLTGKFEQGFTMDLMCKDIAMAIEAGSINMTPMLVSTAVQQLWQHALAEGGGKLDHTAIAAYVERMAGVEIRSKAAGGAS